MDTLSATCNNCDTNFDFVPTKEKVIDSEPDVMGWISETYICICPKCKSEVTVPCLF